MINPLFEDIQILTTLAVDEFVANHLPFNPIATYDCYRALHRLNASIHIVLVHYLGISHESSFLQNSQHGSPLQKWRMFTNQDLECANEAVREFMSKLRGLGNYHEHEEWSSVLEQYWWHGKHYDAYFRFNYSCGYIDEEGKEIISSSFELTPKKGANLIEVTHDIDTHEKRLALIEETKIIHRALIKAENDLRAFLLMRVNLEDLIYKERTA